jgi:hypothetical protein
VYSARERGERREDVAAVEWDDPAPDTRGGLLAAGKRAARQVPECHDYLRVYSGDLGHEVRPTGVDLRRLGGPALWRAALDEGREVDLLTLQPDGGEEPVEQHPRRAPERFSFLVLVETRRLTHDKEFGVQGSFTEDHLRPGLARGTAFAGA